MINNYVNCTLQNKADTKSACKFVVCNIFGKKTNFLLSMGIQVLGAYKLYTNPKSLLALQKSFYG